MPAPAESLEPSDVPAEHFSLHPVRAHEETVPPRHLVTGQGWIAASLTALRIRVRLAPSNRVRLDGVFAQHVRYGGSASPRGGFHGYNTSLMDGGFVSELDLLGGTFVPLSGGLPGWRGDFKAMRSTRVIMPHPGTGCLNELHLGVGLDRLY